MSNDNTRSTDAVEDSLPQPASLDDVLQAERATIAAARAKLGYSTATQADKLQDTLTGLAFSGGGIRSATFNLGVIQALAEHRLLSHFDYLSTVSGGGYIGSWLTALIYRSFNELDKANLSQQTRAQLSGAASEQEKWQTLQAELATDNRHSSASSESPAIAHLRSYSNYLTPRAGIFKADTLTSVATYLRNTFLNLLILIGMVAAILLLPQLAVQIGLATATTSVSFQSVVVAVPAIVALFFINLNLAYTPPPNEHRYPWYTRQFYILLLIVLPVIAIALSSSLYLYNLPKEFKAASLGVWTFYGAAMYFLVWLIGYCFATAMSTRSLLLDLSKTAKYRFLVESFFAIIFAGIFGGIMFWALVSYLPNFGEAEIDMWFVVGFVAPLILLLLDIVVSLHLGFVGRSFSEATREWWARLGGWTLLFILAWTSLFATVIYAPALLERLKDWWQLGTVSWLVSSAVGILFARSAKTDGESQFNWRELIAHIAPYLFVAGLCIIIVSGLQMAIMAAEVKSTALRLCGEKTLLHDIALCQLNEMKGLGADAPHWWPEMFWASWMHWTGWIFMLVFVTSILSWRVDINLFSIYQYYKNRLVRAYLGASRTKRQVNAFTGFDMNDDILMANLQQQRPYHIINTALNLVSGKDLAWQQRKAAAFSIAPLYTGFEMPLNGSRNTGGYRNTAEYLGTPSISLGQALAISGAAASPNMGYHSSPTLAFLMTVFNVRLGRWCGNPAVSKSAKAAGMGGVIEQQLGIAPQIWQRDGPQFGAWYLLRELFASSNESMPFVYLSDGGHFENLAIYELVRRRCKLIVVCDASADKDRAFTDLGNALRKAYVDQGVEIEMNIDALREAQAEKHFAVGTIHYERVDTTLSAGTLLYLKPALCGSEPADVLNYAAEHKDFPHESTADQWFDEAQFESYRKLGHHIASTIFKSALDIVHTRHGASDEVTIESLARALHQMAERPGLATPKH